MKSKKHVKDKNVINESSLTMTMPPKNNNSNGLDSGVKLKVNFVERAWLKKSVYRNKLKSLTKIIIEDTLGEKIYDLNLWIENRNSKIYKMEDVKGRYIVAKQSKNLTFKKLNEEFISLRKLAKIDCEYLSMPEAFGINKEYNVYLMDYVEGNSIASLVGRKDYSKELLKSCKLAGKVIADVHSSWNSDKRHTKNITQLYEDINKIPGKFTKNESIILNKVHYQLINQKLPIGRIYQDYDPLNIYYENGKISLIDPPGDFIKSLLYWDLATFSIGLRKALLKKSLFRMKSNENLLEKCKENFLTEYINNTNYKTSNLTSFYLIIAVIELQRIGQLIIFQEKHRLSSKSFSIRKFYNFFSIKLLNREKKRVISSMKTHLKDSN